MLRTTTVLTLLVMVMAAERRSTAPRAVSVHVQQGTTAMIIGPDFGCRWRLHIPPGFPGPTYPYPPWCDGDPIFRTYALTVNGVPGQITVGVTPDGKVASVTATNNLIAAGLRRDALTRRRAADEIKGCRQSAHPDAGASSDKTAEHVSACVLGALRG